MAVSIAPGKFPAVCESRKGLNYFYWVDDTDVKGSIRARNGDALVSIFTAISGIDQGTAIAVDESYQQGRVWRIGILFIQGGILTYQTSTDGVDFN